MNKDEALKMVIENLELQEFNNVNATLIAYCKEALAQNDNLLTIAYMSGIAEGKSKALEQPAQEPVAYQMTSEEQQILNISLRSSSKLVHKAHPHQWQGLTDDDMSIIFDKFDWKEIEIAGEHLDLFKFTRAIEQALKDKNK